ncbi:MAG: hypothetical protein NXI08_16630, partial [bacterium]|nr:hypothetical protein [bacterium]
MGREGRQPSESKTQQHLSRNQQFRKSYKRQREGEREGEREREKEKEKERERESEREREWEREGERKRGEGEVWVGLPLAHQQSHAAKSCDGTPEPTGSIRPHTQLG